MQFRVYSCWQDLPETYDALFARAAASDFCVGRDWFEALATTILGEDEALAIAGVETAGLGTSLACLVGRHRERDPAFFGARSFTSLSNYYTLRYAPLVDGANVG